MTDFMYKCDECGKGFDYEYGILAEVRDNKVVFDNCTPFTSLTCLCDSCVEIKGISLLTKEQEDRLDEWLLLYEKEFVSIHDVMSAVDQYSLDKSSVLRIMKKRGITK